MCELRTAAPQLSYVNLGCRVNRVELDDIALALEAYGCETASSQPDLCIINSCIVTSEAQAKTRKAVRKAATRHPDIPILVTGCAATLFADELRELSSQVVVEADKSHVPSLALSLLDLSGAEACVNVPRESITPTGRTRPGIKVQDGCDCRCSFCIVWKARGASRSVPYAEILERVRAAQGRGAEELVLTGINLGRFENEQGQGLDWLLKQLLKDTSVGRFRLSSIEPQDMTSDLVDVIAASEGRIAPFVHLPLQSGSDAVLKRMCRNYTTVEYRGVVERVRAAIPDVALCCDYIVGFPGETDLEFEEGLSFAEEMAFSRMHVFRYSARPGTSAATAKGQVDAKIMAERALRVRDMANRARLRFAQSLVGTKQKVVVQSSGKACDGHLIDVLVDPELKIGSLVELTVHGVTMDGLLDARSR